VVERLLAHRTLIGMSVLGIEPFLQARACYSRVGSVVGVVPVGVTE
jgi:hypothetical protein